MRRQLVHDYFFTPMNQEQLKFWQGQRRRGYFDFFLGRGLILGMVIGCIIACLDDVFGKGQGVTDWLFSAFWGIMSSVPMTWFEWYSRQ
jgi:hypothetical protein